MLNTTQIEKILNTTIGDRPQALAIAELLKGKVAEVYLEYCLKSQEFQEFLESRSDFVIYKEDGTTKLIEIDGETANERKQLAQLQAFFLEMEF